MGETAEARSREEAMAPGSSMYDVIIEPEGILRISSNTRTGGDGWIHQQEFTDLMKDIYRQAISKVRQGRR